jgi:hypothetical protein
MSTELKKKQRLAPTVERREQPRFAPPGDNFVHVEMPHGHILLAKVRDMSVRGGTCLALDSDPKVEEGDWLFVSYGNLLNKAEVRHANHQSGQYFVGLRWLTNATLLAVACDSAVRSPDDSQYIGAKAIHTSKTACAQNLT